MPDIITLSTYKTLTGISQSDTSGDLQIAALITAVSQQVDTFFNWQVIQSTLTEVYSGSTNNFLRLRNQAVQSITSITTGFNTSGPVVYPGSDFIFTPIGMVYWSQAVAALPGYFDYGVLNIQVVYVAGYLLANVPADIQRAVALMVQRITLLVSKTAQTNFKLDQYSQTSAIPQLADAMFADVRMILKAYQAVRFI